MLQLKLLLAEPCRPCEHAFVLCDLRLAGVDPSAQLPRGILQPWLWLCISVLVLLQLYAVVVVQLW